MPKEKKKHATSFLEKSPLLHVTDMCAHLETAVVSFRDVELFLDQERTEGRKKTPDIMCFPTSDETVESYNMQDLYEPLQNCK